MTEDMSKFLRQPMNLCPRESIVRHGQGNEQDEGRRDVPVIVIAKPLRP